MVFAGNTLNIFLFKDMSSNLITVFVVLIIIRWFRIILLFIFIAYAYNYNILYNDVLCLKLYTGLLTKGLLNGKIFYYYGDVKINELGYRIQFLLDNFDKINLNTVKYLQKGLIIPEFNPYNSFYHPHFLIELKNNIDNFNNFYINFQLSTNNKLVFDKLADTDLNLNRFKLQYIAPELRVYDANVVELKEGGYPFSYKFIKQNKNNINNYVFKNLEEYVPNFKILKS
jgi:hypothetical protein